MNNNLSNLLIKIQNFGAKSALIEKDFSYSYEELSACINSKRKDYQKSILKGDVVFLISEFNFNGISSLLALLSLNVIVAPVSTSAKNLLDIYTKVIKPNWIIDHSNDEHIIAYENSRATNHNLLEKIKLSKDPGIVLFSSGTTGKPKAMVYDFNIILNKYKSSKSSYISIPFLLFDHFGGINTILGILSSGGAAVSVADRSPSSICSSISQHKVELLPTTPSFLNQLCVGGFLNKYDLSSIKIITYGTEPMSEFLLKKINSLLPNVKFLQTYGLSEVGVLSTRSKNNDSLWIKLTGDGYSFKVVNDTLHIRSDFGMLGYLNMDSPFDSEGYFDTQDKVVVDGDYFKILGRVTDIINVAGLKVYPSEVEDVILNLDGVLDVNVFSEPNALLGSIVVALVQILDLSDSDAIKITIRKHCLQSLEKFKVPQKFKFTTESLVSGRMKKMRVKTK
jgi:long-chain acyl-CoA synthetase